MLRHAAAGTAGLVLAEIVPDAHVVHAEMTESLVATLVTSVAQ